jgi:integrase
MARASEKSGIRLGDKGEKAVLHHGRHTGATYLAAKTGNLDLVMHFGGWSSPEIARQYIKRTEEVFDEVRELANTPVSVIIQSRREAVQASRKGPQAAPSHRRQSVRSGGGR